MLRATEALAVDDVTCRDEYLVLGPEAEIDNRPIWAGDAASLINAIASGGGVVAELAAEAAEVLSS